MTLYSSSFKLVICLIFYSFNSPANDRKNCESLMLKYTNSGTINPLLAINKSIAYQEDILNIAGLEANPVFSKMSKISHILPNSSYTTEHPHTLPKAGLADLNATFDEKAREDAFKKKPAAESPHAVLLLMFYDEVDDKSATCSGSLLTVDWVLTAAHCITPPKGHTISKLLVYAGGYSKQEVETKQLAEDSQLRSAKMFLPHPKYDGDTGGDYDIGLVRVDESFNLTDTVRTVEISMQPWNHRGYRQCQLTGFGIVQMGEERADDRVRKTHTLEVKQPCLCSFRLSIIEGSASKVSRFICARPRQDYGVCPGDSGGGLLCDGKVRGVAMQIVQLQDTITCQISLLSKMQCGSPSALSIFQDSCPFLPWINSHVRLFNDSQISGECVDRGTASGPLRRGAPYLLPLVLVTVILHAFHPVCKV